MPFGHDGHAQPLIVLDGLLGVLDPKHGLGEVVTVLDLSGGPSLYDLHPVCVRIKGEGEALHPALVGLLLEAHACGLEFGALLVHIVARDSDVAEAILLGIPRVVALEAIVGLGPMVVGQLDGNPLVGPQVVVGGLGPRGEVEFCPYGERGDEVEGEVPLREVELVNERHAQHVSVEGEGFGWISDPDHGLLPCGAPGDDRGR